MNGGVVCFDTKFWSKMGLLEQSTSVAEEYGWDSFKNYDQGILNIVAHRNGGFTSLTREEHFNLRDMKRTSGEIRVNGLGLKAPFVEGKSIKLIHWNGKRKPWRAERLGLTAEDREKFYFECYDQFVEKSIDGLHTATPA